MEILGGGDGAWVPRLGGGLEEGIGERSERSRPFMASMDGLPRKVFSILSNESNAD